MDAGLPTRHQVFGCFVTIWLVGVCVAHAQNPSPSGGTASTDANPPRDVVTESDLKIFWLRGKSGELVPVADLTVEEYTRLRLLEEKLIPRDAAPEVYAFQGDIGFSGKANEDEAQFTVQFNIRLRDNGDEQPLSWVRVPLRLNQTILMPGAKHVGAGEFFILYEKQGDGYVAWLRAPPNSEHAITLNIKLPVVRVAGKLRVSMLTPPRPTQLQLEVPGTNLEVTTNNIEENILTTKRIGDTKTRIAVENIGGPLEITWRDTNRSAPVLESTATTTATINGQQIDYVTNLRVRSYGAPIRTFDVRLPADAILIPEPTPGVNVDVVGEPLNKARLIRVTREDGKDEGTLEVRLKAFSISPAKVLVGQTDISGFEVVDAVRQTGTMELEVKGDWTVDWFPGSYVRQMPVTEAERQGGTAARFEYDRQPYTLKVEVRERESRIRVAPTYSLYVEADQVRLVGNLKYSASGARIRELQIQAEGWQVDRVLPADSIAATISLAETMPLTIPLLPNGKPITDDFEIRVEAHQPISADDKSFRVILPTTVNGVASPAEVIVYAADNIDLTLRGDEIKGLIAESAPAELELPKTQQAPLYYVEEPSDTAPVFAAEFAVRSRLVAANADNTLRFSANALAIEQRFDLDISYEPLRQIKFTLPDALISNDQIQFFELISDPKAATNGGVRERPLPVLGMLPSEDVGIAEITVDLLEDRIMRSTVVARYSIPFNPRAEGDPLAVKLIRVAADPSISFGTCKLRLVTTEEVDVDLMGDGWNTLIDDLLDPSSREQLFQTSGDVARVDVVARLVRTPQRGATVLENFWLQTHLSRSERVDRACFQLRTNAERLQVQLPAGAALRAVIVQGEDKPNATASTENVVNVELADKAEAGAHTIEVWYGFAAKDVPLARLTVEPPTLIGVPHARRIFWQLILPYQEHLLVPPASLTPEYVWRWDLNHWGRQSNLRQADLESMLNATTQWSPADGVVNQYLFTSVGAVRPVDFITASRGSLTLVFSLAVLVGGLCLIYFSWSRHPASLLIVGVLIVAMGFVFPEPTILAAQAAALGIPFVLLARFLHRNASRRRMIPTTASGSSISMVDSQEGFVTPAVSEGNSHTTTTLAPATYQVPIVEPKP